MYTLSILFEYGKILKIEIYKVYRNFKYRRLKNATRT